MEHSGNGAGGVGGAEWWRSAIIYQVYPRSFFSARGNGIGDLAGVAAKADYLRRLGVDIVWLSPFFKSPMKDYGYDVSDYRDVDPMFGSMGDFDTLVDVLHRHGLRIMIDQVYNHTSDQHPWFTESSGGRDNPKADWYVWKNPTASGTPPNNWLSVFSGPAWTWHSERRQYYLHQFLSQQPDLDFNNPAVQEAILEVAEFWLRRKVDGFRLDTVSRYAQHADYPSNPALPDADPANAPVNPHRMQQELYNQGQPETLAFLRRLRTLANRYGRGDGTGGHGNGGGQGNGGGREDAGAILLGELGAHNEADLQEQYTAGGDALHIAYTFALLNDALTPPLIAATCAQTQRSLKRGWPSWSFSNHDVVRALTRNSAVAPADHDRYAKLLLTVLLALRGTPCIYQGEELALSDQDLEYHELRDPFSKALWPKWRGRDGCRTPIPWRKDQPYGGFSTVEPWLPVKENHLARAVDQQEDDPRSTLNFYRQFIPWRKRQAALCGRGALTIEEATDELLVLTREGSPSVCCLYNFSDRPQEVKRAGELLPHPQGEASQSGDILRLPPYGSAFVRV